MLPTIFGLQRIKVIDMRYEEIAVSVEGSAKDTKMQMYLLDNASRQESKDSEAAYGADPVRAADMRRPASGKENRWQCIFEQGLSCLRPSVFRGALPVPGTGAGSGSSSETDPRTCEGMEC